MQKERYIDQKNSNNTMSYQDNSNNTMSYQDNSIKIFNEFSKISQNKHLILAIRAAEAIKNKEYTNKISWATPNAAPGASISHENYKYNRQKDMIFWLCSSAIIIATYAASIALSILDKGRLKQHIAKTSASLLK